MSAWYVYPGVASAVILVALLLAEKGLRHYSRRLSVAAFLAFLILLVIMALLAQSAGRVTGTVESKGETSSLGWIMVALMYVAMTMGIIAQSYYFRDDGSPAGYTSWIKPTLASPIIFIPLLSSYQDTLSTISSLSLAQLMILLVSFQNGFFWKVIFDKQTKAMTKKDSEKSAV